MYMCTNHHHSARPRLSLPLPEFLCASVGARRASPAYLTVLYYDLVHWDLQRRRRGHVFIRLSRAEEAPAIGNPTYARQHEKGYRRRSFLPAQHALIFHSKSIAHRQAHIAHTVLYK
jgi:hypothetical protein